MVLITKTLFKNQEKREELLKDQAWSREVRTRDGYACVICNSPIRTNAHHLIPREHKLYKYSYDNGITLCIKHHKYSRVISAHNNPLAFFLWLAKYKPDLYKLAVERQAEVCKEECDI